MKYIASVTYEGKLEIIEREYKTKSAFYSDLRGNGYRVRFISTEENFDSDCAKYHEACELNKSIKKEIYKSYKEQAASMNMSVAEFKAWLKG